MRRYAHWLVSLSLFFTTLSCGDRGDFLHYIPAGSPARTFDTVHNVKELIGSSRADIVWVIDASGSMSTWQKAVAKNTDVFMQGFVQKAKVDWRMGLLSMDDRDAPFIGFRPGDILDGTSVDPVQKFQRAIGDLRNAGGGEATFDPVYRALTDYPNFVRSNAALVLILVTDAPEQSSSISAQPFLDFLKQTKGDLKRVFTYGILGPQDWGCPDTDDFWNYKDSEYEKLITGTVGKTYKLCDPNFAQNLIALGEDIGQQVGKPRLDLPVRPRLSSIKVFYEGRELPGGAKEAGGFWVYDYDQNAIVFHDLGFAPGNDEKVRVQYREDDGTK